MLLTVENLSYIYPGKGKPALAGVSFAVRTGEYVAVLGANGSGKSTLARCIVGLLDPVEGRVTIDKEGAKSPGLGGAALVPSALVFQTPGDQFVSETAELDVAFGPENLGMPREDMLGLVPAALSRFSLSAYAQCSTESLTSGQKQHLALAGVHVLSPALLLLDEPTSMLSPAARESVLVWLDRFHAGGGTIFHITHDVAEAARADRVIVFDDGALVFDGPSGSLSAAGAGKLRKWGLASSVTVSSPRDLDRDSPDVPPVLQCRDVTFGPLRDFSLTARRGTVTAVMGESGSGKSLLLEILAGIRVPDSGVVELAPGAAAALAVQESEASLFAEFVADDVVFGPRNAGVEGRDLVTRVSSAMDLVGLPFAAFANRQTFSLSGGERRKAALAGIVAMETDIVLLDEPSSALDTSSRDQLLSLILGLRTRGKTIVFTTNREEECAIADAIIRLPDPDSDVSARQCASRQSAPANSRRKMTRDQQSLDRLRKGASREVRPDTAIHRLSPLSKYVLTLTLVVAALTARSWPFVALLCALECVPVAVSRYSFKKLALGILKILPWLVLIGIIQYVASPGSLYSIDFILRFIALYIPLVLFLHCASHTEIMYGMEDLLSPLRIAKLPVRDVALVTGIVFRFIPLLYGEAARIMTARIIRGAGSGRKKGLFSTLSATASLFVPLMLRTLTRAERLAQAITARYYGTGKNSRYLLWKTGNAQRILILSVMLLAGVLVYLSVKIRI